MAARKSRPRKAGSKPKAVKPRAPKADASASEILGGIGLGDVRQLIRLVQKTGIGELEIQSGDRTVRIAAHAGNTVSVGVPVSAASVAHAPERPAAPAASPAAPAPSEDFAAITSPMVGTFYRAPAPDADPYVETGDTVEMGQTVCIIEAMKLMNEIESEVKGRIVKVLVENAQPVEFGQKLFLVEPV
jgi:oxaloacetate decarboxylase (Na+ extruding) subunit alpha